MKPPKSQARRLTLLNDAPMERRAAKAAVSLVRHWRDQGFDKVHVLAVPDEMLKTVVPDLLLHGWHTGALGDHAQWFMSALFQTAFPEAQAMRTVESMMLYGVLYGAGALAESGLVEEGIQPEGIGFEFRDGGVDIKKAEPIEEVFLYAAIPVSMPDGVVSDEKIGVAIPKGRLIGKLRAPGPKLPERHDEWCQRLAQLLVKRVLEVVRPPDKGTDSGGAS